MAAPILYVEDDPDDRLLAELAHRDSGIPNPLVFVVDGREALEYLARCERDEAADGSPRPALILLDLNMPGLGGDETLRRIKGHASLRRIPVVMFSTSDAAEDIGKSYDAGANSFIVKPTSYRGLIKILVELDRYWFETVAPLPERSR